MLQKKNGLKSTAIIPMIKNVMVVARITNLMVVAKHLRILLKQEKVNSPITKENVMTKKDYVKIAAVIKYHINRDSSLIAGLDSFDDQIRYEELSDLAQDLAVVFLEDNPRFDQDRFLEACGL